MRVELLSAKHDRSLFSCGVPVLDSYIKERAKDERIKPFNERYGFKPIKDDKLRLYLPLNSIPGI